MSEGGWPAWWPASARGTTFATGLAIGLVLVTSVVLAGEKKGGTKDAADKLKLNVSLAEKGPQLIVPGGEIEASYALKNRSPRKEKAGRLRFFLSADKTKKGPDIALSPAVRLGWLKGKEKEKGDVSLRVPDQVTASSPSEGQAQRVATRAGLGHRRSTLEPLRLLACTGSVCGATGRTVTPGTPAPTSPGGSPPGGPSPGPGGSSPPPPANTTLSGQVLFAQRDCYQGNAVRELPLANAQIQLVPEGATPIPAQLDAQGRFQDVKVPGASRIDAYAITDGPRVRVTPDVDHAQPYRIPLGEVTSPNQTFRIGSLGSTAPWFTEGAANIYGVLEEGARVAADISHPVEIPEVRARWRYGPHGVWLNDHRPSQYDSSNNSIIVGGKLFPPSGRDEYEKWALLHEYGHHVLNTVTGQPDLGPPDETHGFETVHPEHPGLPWWEGFGNAFAAIVTRSAQQTLGCTTRVDMGAEPATASPDPADPLEPMPPPGKAHLAQYNEVATAGALWALANRFGAGDPHFGLKQLLSAFRAFHAKYGGPDDLREARDALIYAGLETTADQHQELTELFADQRIGWAFQVYLDHREGYPVTEARLKVEGPAPYGTCDGSSPEFANGAPADWFYGSVHARGALDYAWQDDCYNRMWSNFAQPQAIPYPATGQPGNPNETFTVSARWSCHGNPPPCPPLLPDAEIGIGRGAYFRDQFCPTCASHWRLHDWGPWHVAAVGLPPDVWTPIAEFDALGRCKSLLDGWNCEDG